MWLQSMGASTLSLFSHDFDIECIWIFAILGATILSLHYLIGIAKDSREPPFLPQRFPYFGHLFGIIRFGTKYYDTLSAKHALPAYSLAMPRGRMYIIKSPELVMAVQRNAKTLSSAPFAAKYAARVVQVSKETEAIWFHDVEGESDDGSLFVDGMKAMQASLTPGSPELDHIVTVMLNSFQKPCRTLDNQPQKRKLSLMAWLRDELTLAATDAIYGPTNPFQASAVRNGFWDFYTDFTKLLINIFPTITASKGFAGRKACFLAVEQYLRHGGPSQGGSGLVNALVNTTENYGVNQEDIAHFDILNIQAALANVTPTAFWTLYHIFADPALLIEVRREVQGCVSTDKTYPNISLLDVGKLRTTCPLIHSVFQEVLRYRSYNASVRVVLKDTLLQGRYLLKKDGVIHMPSHVIHNDATVWGPTATQFDPRRFLSQSASGITASIKEQKRHPGAFRAFGGGTTLCPGRHFATTTIISIVAMLVHRYDMIPTGGKWINHTQNISHLVAAILPPDQDVEVNIVPRDEKKTWTFIMGDKSAASFSGADS